MNETQISGGTSLVEAQISRRTLERLVRTALRDPGRPGPIAHLVRGGSAAPSGLVDASPPHQRAALVGQIIEELRRWTKSPGDRRESGC